MKKLTIFFCGVLLCTPLQVFAETSLAAQTEAVRAGVGMMQGTWILKSRIAPNGAQHAQPIEGITVFKLDMDTSGPVPRAVGSLYSMERGVLDAVVSQEEVMMAAAPSSNQLFEIEATSDVDVRASPDSTRTSATITMAHTNLFVKGTYGVFRNGISTPRVENRYRTKMVANRTGLKGASTVRQMSLVTEARQSVPAAATGYGSLGDRSHQFASLSVTGDRMDITWGNGAKDVWVRSAK